MRVRFKDMLKILVLSLTAVPLMLIASALHVVEFIFGLLSRILFVTAEYICDYVTNYKRVRRSKTSDD